MATPFTNKATITYNGISAVSNTVSGQINDVLSITKNAVYNSYIRGDIVTYVVSLINLSAQPFTNITLTDDLGAYEFTPAGATTPIKLHPLTYKTGSVSWIVDGVPQTTELTAAIDADKKLVISGVNVSAQGAGTGITHVMYEVYVNEFAPVGTGETLEVENEVLATGVGITGELKAAEIITPEDALDITIEKQVSPTTVAENGALTYTLTVRNFGARASVDGDGIVISDTFNPYLANFAVKLDGAVWDAANYTYTNAGLFTTAANAVSVEAATIAQNTTTGVYEIVPSVKVFTITGTVANNPV